MSDYQIPSDYGELFANGEAYYSIEDKDQSGDNIFAMKLFLEVVGVPESFVEFDEGTRVILFDGETRIQIDSEGLGDFNSHGFSVTLLNPKNEKD